ncbi:MAG: NAD(P)-binding protein [Actinomycetota bacterium]|nr:NAD(P)-binding protein [Actinomycetota bacterium]
MRPRYYTRHIDRRVAVAGGGPAGITAAVELASMGYRVTIYEVGDGLGGMLRRAVPGFRLPDEVWRREFEEAVGEGIDVVHGARVGCNPTIGDLFERGFKAVLLDVGASNGRKIFITGCDYQGVHNALSFMAAVKDEWPMLVGERAGGGGRR